MARLYTRTGDDGTTGLMGGDRVLKSDLRMHVIGDLDELNAALGLSRAAGLSPFVEATLLVAQSHLFSIGAEFASEPGSLYAVQDLTEAHVAALEAAIDGLEDRLEPLRNFILPGGAPSAASLHLTRAVARRAERALVAFAQDRPVRSEVARYINRLSDWLFAAARYENVAHGVPETLWTR